MSFFERLQHIDRRIMYLLLVVSIAVPLIWKVKLPVVVSPAVRGVYDTIEKMPSDKIALIVVYWGAGTYAETGPETSALMRHLFMRNKKFALLPFDPQGSKFATDEAKKLAREYGKRYGEDWVHWGYQPISNLVPLLQSFPSDIKRTFKADVNGTPMDKIPMMRNVNDIHDIGVIADITSSGELDYWIAYVYGSYRTPMVYGPTAIIAPEGFNALDAGQIKGMLMGMKGAAEYEKLLNSEDFATRAAGALSTSHLLIVFLIIAGNIGYLSARRRREA